MASTIGAGGEPAYVYDTSPASEVMYDGNFYFDPNRAITANPVDVFLGIDQSGRPIFGIQYKYLDANSYELRAWFLNAEKRQYSGWTVYTAEPGDDDPVVLVHKLEVAWISGAKGGLSFYLDDRLAATMSANIGEAQLEEVILGPSLGLSAGDSGTMYFDEFTSSRVVAVSYQSMLPFMTK
jgi:hypothetical protein